MRASVLACAAAIALGFGAPAEAGIFLSGSISAASFNGGLQSQDVAGGSGTVGFEFSQYIRLGYTHKRQTQTREGWMGRAEGQCDYSNPSSLDTCLAFEERVYVIADSFDLSLVLYNGEVVAPYVLAGLILRTSDYKRVRSDGETIHYRTFSPGPNLGGGMHVRLNKQFALKLQYTVSPGAKYTPSREERSVWDKDMSLGVTYQL